MNSYKRGDCRVKAFYSFFSMEPIPAEEIRLPQEAEEGDIYSCFGLLYQVVGKSVEKDRIIYQMKFI